MADLSPRFASDKEDDAGKGKKALFEEPSEADKQRILEARKQGRGFTMSVGAGASAPEDPEMSALRSEKRAQTLPAMSTRRGDQELSAEAEQKLKEELKTLQARHRRGSASLAFSVVPDEVLEETFKKACLGHSHGIMTEGQVHSDEREHVEYGAKPLAIAPVISCQKGSKGFKDKSPNQDNFSVTYFKSGWTLVCTFDGHGPFGHIVSHRTVQTVPYMMIVDHGFDEATVDEATFEKALMDSFDKAQKDLLAHSLENGWDAMASGSTAVAALFKGNKIWTANAGDSRVAVGTEADKKVVFETEDHKPQTPKEKERIEASGGEVRTQVYPDGWVNHRIFVKGEDFPGLCMARTFGDQSVKNHGVIATPEVASCEVDLTKKPFFVIASDGVWEFLESAFVVKAVAKKLATDGAKKTLEKLQREAKKRWKQEEGDYCDDITSMLVQLA